MATLRIVLVEPREAGNVGAVARVMKNFGFGDLTIVGETPPLQPTASWWASGAEDLVGSARRAATLEEALADAHVTVATTSARERNFEPELRPDGVAELLARLSDSQHLALVFGREDRGLSLREVAACQRTAAVATWPEFPTLNLAQSVAIFCYEAARAKPLRTTVERTLADVKTVDRLHQRAQQLLLEIGFLHQNNPDRIYDDLRALAGRAELDQREATILLGIIHQIEWKLGK